MCKPWKNQKKARCDSKQFARPVKDAHALKLGCERTQHFCNACNIALKRKDAPKIHEKGHDVDCGFKCAYCHMTEWDLMEKSFKITQADTSNLPVNVFMCHKVPGKCTGTAIGGNLLSFSAQSVNHLWKLSRSCGTQTLQGRWLQLHHDILTYAVLVVMYCPPNHAETWSWCTLNEGQVLKTRCWVNGHHKEIDQKKTPTDEKQMQGKKEG
ncbi:uncharacterized protein O9250_007049 [Rhynochetos jubatus]